MKTSKRVDHPRTSRVVRGNKTSAGAARCRRKFLRFFPGGFRDETYLDWERNYKWKAHEQWNTTLDRATYRSLLRNEEFHEIAVRSVRIESRTNLLFSFEKMALRDAVKSREGAHAFVTGLYDFLYSAADMTRKFQRWCDVVATDPETNADPYVASGDCLWIHRAAASSSFPQTQRHPRRSSRVWVRLQLQLEAILGHLCQVLEFADVVKRNLRDLRPRDMIDIQSFIWVQGSDEYDE